MAYSLTYSFNSTSLSYSVNGYSNITESDIVVIPDTYDDGMNGSHPVTSIVESAFSNCSGLTSVTIGNGVTSIGRNAFSGTAYYNNESNWQDGVLYIGNHLIEAKTSILGDYVIKSGTLTIADYAFYGCSSLTSVTIPDSVTSIGINAFYNCSGLTSVTISGSVTSIGNYAFYNCTSLQSIVIFAEIPPTLGATAIPSNVQSIYVAQSSKAAYRAATTNWNAFASKIVSDNLYLSFVRFNTKNKEYISEQVSESKDYADAAIEKAITTTLNTAV